MLDRNSSRGRNGHRSSSGFDAIDPSALRIDDMLGARGSSRGVITSTTIGPGASSSPRMRSVRPRSVSMRA
jgi:hypothetical protein